MSSASPSSQDWKPGAASRLFNFIASALLIYLLVDVLKEPGNMSPETRVFAPSAHLPGVHAVLAQWGVAWPNTPLNLSVLLAVAAALEALVADPPT